MVRGLLDEFGLAGAISDTESDSVVQNLLEHINIASASELT
jgi:hypothetical protein